MRFQIKIETDNAAFHDENCTCDDLDEMTGECPDAAAAEVSRILRGISEKLDERDGHLEGVLHDYNGNLVGKWDFTNS